MRSLTRTQRTSHPAPTASGGSNSCGLPVVKALHKPVEAEVAVLVVQYPPANSHHNRNSFASRSLLPPVWLYHYQATVEVGYWSKMMRRSRVRCTRTACASWWYTSLAETKSTGVRIQAKFTPETYLCALVFWSQIRHGGPKAELQIMMGLAKITWKIHTRRTDWVIL